jgi:hypothetical protein
MRRIKLAVVVGVVMAAMLVFSAGPAMADDFDFDGIDDNDFCGVFGCSDNNNDFCDVFGCFGFGGAPAALEFEQDIGDTGDVTLTTDVSSTGDSSNQTVAPLQFGNTGNLQNAQGFVQFDSTADDIEFEGSSFSFAPTLTNTSNQAVKQSSAA